MQSQIEASAFDEDAQEDLRIKMEKAQIEHDLIPDIVRQMDHLQIDFQAVRLYFKLLRQAIKDDDQLRDSISTMVELVMFEWSSCQNNTQPEKRLMCARGLLMLLQIECISDFDWLKIAMEIITALNKVYSLVQSQQQRMEKKLTNQDMLVQYIASFSGEQIHEFVMQL